MSEESFCFFGGFIVGGLLSIMATLLIANIIASKRFDKISKKFLQK